MFENASIQKYYEQLSKAKSLHIFSNITEKQEQIKLQKPTINTTRRPRMAMLQITCELKMETPQSILTNPVELSLALSLPTFA